MSTTQPDNSPMGPSPEEVEAAWEKLVPKLERLKYLRQRRQDGTTTPKEEEEYDDMTWWMHGPMPTLPPPYGTPNPWELPRSEAAGKQRQDLTFPQSKGAGGDLR